MYFFDDFDAFMGGSVIRTSVSDVEHASETESL